MRAYPTRNRGCKGWPLVRGVAAYGDNVESSQEVAATIGSSRRTTQRKIKRMCDGNPLVVDNLGGHKKEATA